MVPPEMDPWLSELLKNIDDHCKRTEAKIDALIKDVQANYVSKVELSPIKIIVYGMAGFILAAFIGIVIFRIGWSK